MFEPIEEDALSPFHLALRISFLVLAGAIDAGVIYVVLYPGNDKAEMFERGITGILLLVASAILSLPVLSFVVWKLIKKESAKFWIVSFFVSSFPIILLIVIVAFGILFS